MVFLAILTALIFDLYLLAGVRRQSSRACQRFATLVRTSLDGEHRHHGALVWVIIVIPIVLIIILSYHYVHAWDPVFAWIINVALLYLTSDFKSVADRLTKLPHALRRGNPLEARGLLEDSVALVDGNEIARIGIEQALWGVHRSWFAVVFWFAILPGPAGAVLYFLARVLAGHWMPGAEEEGATFGTFAHRVVRCLDWVPARLSAVTFAIVGDFEDAVFCWRSQARSWPDHNQGLVLASGAGAIGVRIGDARHTSSGIEKRPELGLGDPADADAVQAAEGLIWRGVVFWIGFLLLISLISWLS